MRIMYRILVGKSLGTCTLEHVGMLGWEIKCQRGKVNGINSG